MATISSNMSVGNVEGQDIDIDIFEFLDIDLEILSHCVSKQGKPPFNATARKHYSLARRRVFADFVASTSVFVATAEGRLFDQWNCCGHAFRELALIHKHVARTHDSEISRNTEAFLESVPGSSADEQPGSLSEDDPVDVSRWIPDTSGLVGEQLVKGPGEVLLFYCYCPLQNPRVICQWQNVLCQKLCLTGKIRVAAEGINGTLGGTKVASGLYINAMLSHPALQMMVPEDFKHSEGGADCFSELRVGLYKEIVPMGVDPAFLSDRRAGVHLDPKEFHQEVEMLLAKGDSCTDTILLDCRNFYESKIGQFSKCVAPDIRKFSYFPDYVDKNLELFRDKKVLMYCTGGIRCERGSAYLLSKDVCKEVYQLKGGIHKYLEKFPEGFYRGKLFVFDQRYAIAFNDDIISGCRYCRAPWDQYQLCSTQFCCQLVLSCPSCRGLGHTACCPTCQVKGQGCDQNSPAGIPLKEECECTDVRPRVPRDAF